MNSNETSLNDIKTTIVVNGRYKSHQVTGVQRYAHEIVCRLGETSNKQEFEKAFEVLSPNNGKGKIGHLWEQVVLPAACKGRLLWSPSGNGPALYSNQVVTFHDIFPIEHPEWYGTSYARWYRLLMTRLSSQSMHIIAVSEYTKARLIKFLGCSPEKITVIHNGLTSGCERVSTDRIGAARSALKLPTRRYVLSLSSLEKRKNLRTTLEAWALVHSSLPDDIWLVLAGPVANEAVYGPQDLPRSLPRVLYTGYVPEEHLAGLYSGASLFLFPSLAEGFGFPLLEAMACGVRSITSNTTSLPEIGGDVVTYVDPTDAVALCGCIRQAFEAGATPDTPFLPAMERAKTFSWDKSASLTKNVLAAASCAPKYQRQGDQRYGR